MIHFKTILKNVSVAVLAGIFLFSCNSGSNSNTTQTPEKDTTMHSDMQMSQAPVPIQPSAVADLTATYTDTALTGKAAFSTEADGKVKLQLSLHIPAKANKEVAVHIHEHGDCGDTGKNAHGHWNPTNDTHGKWGSAHFHLGDIGNVKLDKKGDGTLDLTTDLWTLGGDSTKNILGKAIIVHGGSDDFVTQPTGNAGGRIGCGVIK